MCATTAAWAIGGNLSGVGTQDDSFVITDVKDWNKFATTSTKSRTPTRITKKNIQQ